MNIPHKKHLQASIFLLIIVATMIFLFVPRNEQYQPLHRLSLGQHPYFEDDYDIRSLILCAESQIHYLKKQPTGTIARYGEDTYSLQWLIQSTEDLIAKLREHPKSNELNSFLSKNYIIYQAGGRKGVQNREMLVTGYYEPTFEGSLYKGAPYLTPIYSRPDSLVSITEEDNTTKITGRYDSSNNLTEYWSRAEIEKKGILQGYEIAYMRDPFDAFLLHVQGSGRIRLPDGTSQSVHFAASNGRTYNSIGKLLVEEGVMTLEDVNIPAIRSFLQEHPEQQERILHHNPRYIFFAFGDDRGPRGSSGEILTPGRSVAIDNSVLPAGSIGYIQTRRPVINHDNEVTGWKRLTRFVFPQDTGAAIKGSGRLDMFWGNGDSARIAANHMKEEGQLFFLVKRGSSENVQ